MANTNSTNPHAKAAPPRHSGQNSRNGRNLGDRDIQLPQDNKVRGLLKDPLEKLTRMQERIMPKFVSRREAPIIHEMRYPTRANRTPQITPPKQITTHSTENDEFTSHWTIGTQACQYLVLVDYAFFQP
jgi:hypothetical protein